MIERAAKITALPPVISPNRRPIRNDVPPVWITLRRLSRCCTCPSSCAITPAISSGDSRLLQQRVEQIDFPARQRDGIGDGRGQHRGLERQTRCRRRRAACSPSRRTRPVPRAGRTPFRRRRRAPAGRPLRRSAFPGRTERAARDGRRAAECRTPSRERWSTPPRATSPRSARSAGPASAASSEPQRDISSFATASSSISSRASGKAETQLTRKPCGSSARRISSYGQAAIDGPVFDDLELLRETQRHRAFAARRAVAIDG